MTIEINNWFQFKFSTHFSFGFFGLVISVFFLLLWPEFIL